MHSRRIFHLLLILILCGTVIWLPAQAASLAWDGRTIEEYSGGTGSQSDPYQISNGAQFVYWTMETSTAKTYYKLTADIDLGNKSFPMMLQFDGVLDGDGHRILNLNIESTDTSSTSIAAMIQTCKGTVKNLSVYGTVTSSSYYTASIAGKLVGGTIQNCYNYCTIDAGSRTSGYVGGIAGSVSGKGEVLDCGNLGAVYGNGATGGIVGSVSHGTVEDADVIPSVTGCQNVAAVSGGNAGGICGEQGGTTISLCVNTGNVSGNYAGGIVGTSYSRNCISVGKVNGSTRYTYLRQSSHIHDCYNVGQVSATKAAGGIAAYFTYCNSSTDGVHDSRTPSMSFKNCYNVGTVVSEGTNGTFGDIIGMLGTANGKQENCLYLSGNNPNATSSLQSRGIACTETQLSTIGVYTNNAFNFTSVWTWDNSNAYPYAILRRVGMPMRICQHDFRLTSTTATCVSGGVATKTCVDCGEVVKEAVPAKGHIYAEPEFSWSSDLTFATASAVCYCGNEETETCVLTWSNYKTASGGNFAVTAKTTMGGKTVSETQEITVDHAADGTVIITVPIVIPELKIFVAGYNENGQMTAACLPQLKNNIAEFVINAPKVCYFFLGDEYQPLVPYNNFAASGGDYRSDPS